MMIVRGISYFILFLALAQNSCSKIAPEITTVAEGYNVIAKLPCAECPFLYQDTSSGRDGEWTQRKDESALLLNISLPFDSAHLAINNGAFLTESKILPKIYANQVLLDTSVSDIDNLVSSNALDTLGGGYFGLSYAFSTHRLAKSRALLFRFDILELWSDLTPESITVPMTSPKQKLVEIVLLPRPLLSAGDPSNAFEIARVELISRPENEPRKGRRTMWFLDWDDHGKKGTTSHALNSASESFVEYISSGVWSLFIFIMAIIGFFVVIIILILFSCGLHKDDYERAQHGKRSGGRGSGSWGTNDVEKARRFRSAEELGFRSAGKVVGIGKSD